MTVVTRIPRKSRLSSIIDQPGGVSVGVALTQARANLQTFQAQSQAIVAERVAELAAITAPTTLEEAFQKREQAYAAASSVIDAAGPFELTDICAAAAGLCDLVDAARADRIFDWRIVTVHAQALRLMLTLPPEAAEARQQILENLKQVLLHKLGARED
ncbi:chemotaxis protein CheE [Brevundimonas sp. S30B]|uniref:chemotaxis protein CheE n=1 Tax=unclassified Brevundimonas TaxID=2622653 RepID=UPI001071B9D6|nr:MULTISPECIES: chemotaxis protein CheE [unclassified Brevundimonas]QBX38183.1 chemotaxis protein CheE [Brevundimonas sp. MF30-B]TFW01681.1 chemotaxis protein CheE [Brevundimonas sp. S30B]